MNLDNRNQAKKKTNLIISITLGLLVIGSVALPFVIMGLRDNLIIG